MAVESHSVTPEAHDAAKAGNQPYYEGQEKPAEEAAETEEAATEEEKPSDEAGEEEAKAEGEEKPKEEAADEKSAEEDASDSIDYTGYYEEWTKTGNLSEESRSAILEKLPGVPPEMIDTYLAGLGALRAQAEQAAYDLVGGKDQYASLQKWGAENLTPEEAVEYNNALDRGGAAAASAIKGLKARMKEAGGNPEPSYAHTATPAPGEPPLKSRAELMQKMRDPRWEKDPAYRKSVEDQLARSMQSPDYRKW